MDKLDKNHPTRFHLKHAHLETVFGNDWFALKAEAFARFFGTPTFLLSQTFLVILWIGLNESGITHFDVYPFILLNLAFSLQAAYAAPLILLAQTRQADRDKVFTEADARHREDLAQAGQNRMDMMVEQNTLLMDVLQQNTRLTEQVEAMSKRIEALTVQVHGKIIANDSQYRS